MGSTVRVYILRGSYHRFIVASKSLPARRTNLSAYGKNRNGEYPAHKVPKQDY
jgi:hypothetical protein